MSDELFEIDSRNAICPYCGHSYQVEGEDYTDDPVEEECEECGKKYLRWTVHSVDHWTQGINAEKAKGGSHE